MAKVDGGFVVTISPGVSYRFTAREVMDLLIRHANMSEREAADTVTKFAAPRQIEVARRDLQDAREAVEDYERELRRLEGRL